jgi:hypothetical protein
VEPQPERAGLRERAAELQGRVQPFVEPILIPLGLVAVATLVHFFVVWAQSRAIGSTVPPLHALSRWDGGFYLQIARYGYPTKLATKGPHAPSRLAFYPLYPIVVRSVYRITPFSLLTSGLIVAVTSTAGAALVFWQLAARLSSRSAATRSVALLLFAPGAIVLSMTYSEPLFILLACACLWALVEHRWELAGIFAFLGCLARPSGIALVVACVVAAFVALMRDRHQWRALAAPFLSIAGFLVLPFYDLVHVGDFFVFWKAERDGWGAHVDFGLTALRDLHRFVLDPFHDFNIFMTVAAMAFVAVGLVLMVFWRPPPEIAAYTLVIVALALGTATLNSTFRFTMAAVPLYIAYARVLRTNTLLILLAVSAALFAVAGAASLTLLYTP